MKKIIGLLVLVIIVSGCSLMQVPPSITIINGDVPIHNVVVVLENDSSHVLICTAIGTNTVRDSSLSLSMPFTNGTFPLLYNQDGLNTNTVVGGVTIHSQFTNNYPSYGVKVYVHGYFYDDSMIVQKFRSIGNYDCNLKTNIIYVKDSEITYSPL